MTPLRGRERVSVKTYNVQASVGGPEGAQTPGLDVEGDALCATDTELNTCVRAAGTNP